MGTPILYLSFLRPVLGHTAQQHSLSLSLSLSFSLDNPSPLTAPNQAQFPITVPQLHSTCHAYQICQLTNGRAGQTARILYKKRTSFQPEIIQRLHQKEGTSARTSSSIIKKDLAVLCIRKGQSVLILQGVNLMCG